MTVAGLDRRLYRRAVFCSHSSTSGAHFLGQSKLRRLDPTPSWIDAEPAATAWRRFLTLRDNRFGEGAWARQSHADQPPDVRGKLAGVVPIIRPCR